MSRALLADQRVIVRSEFGEDVERRALATLTPEDLEVVTRPDTLGWCDVHVGRRYKDAVGLQVGQTSLEFQRWIVRRAAERTVKGVWRMLLTQVWDEALVKRIPIMYQHTFNTGRMTGTFESKGRASITVTGWPDIPEYDIVGLQTGMEAILNLTGRPNTTSQPARTPDGVNFRVRWDTK